MTLRKAIAIGVGVVAVLGYWSYQEATKKPPGKYTSKKINTSPEYRARMEARSALIRQASQAAASNNFALAEQILNQLLQDGDDPMVSYQLAGVLDRAGREEQALAAYEEVVNPGPGSGSSMQTDPIVLGRYIDLCLQHNQAANARSAMDRILESGRVSLGGASLPAVSRTPQSEQERVCFARTMVGIHHRLRGADVAARAEFQKAVDAKPDSGVARFYLAYMKEDAREWQAALQGYQAALSLAGADNRLRAAAQDRIERLQVLLR